MSPVPGLAQWAFDMIRALIVEDIIFYFSHVALHHPLLYKAIHKVKRGRRRLGVVSFDLDCSDSGSSSSSSSSSSSNGHENHQVVG